MPLLALVPPTVYAAPPYMGEIPPSQRRAIVPEAEVAAAVTSKQLAKFVLALVHLPPLCVSPGSSDVAAAAAPSAGDTAVRRRPLGMRAMCEACKTMRVSWLLYWRCDHPDYTDKDCWVLVGEFYPGYGGLIGEVSLQVCATLANLFFPRVLGGPIFLGLEETVVYVTTSLLCAACLSGL